MNESLSGTFAYRSLRKKHVSTLRVSTSLKKLSNSVSSLEQAQRRKFSGAKNKRRSYSKLLYFLVSFSFSLFVDVIVVFVVIVVYAVFFFYALSLWSSSPALFCGFVDLLVAFVSCRKRSNF